MSVNRASEVWKEIKPFAIRDMNSMIDNKSGDGSDDLYAIILYDESAQKIKYYAANGDGLTAALSAASSGDVVEIPPGVITGGPWTVPAGVSLVGMGNNCELSGNLSNNGTVLLIKISGNVTNNAGGAISRTNVSPSTGTGITQTGNGMIEFCRVNMGVDADYGIDITAGRIANTYVGTDGGTKNIGLYVHGAEVDIVNSRFAGFIGGKVEIARRLANCSFSGIPTSGSLGLIHSTTGTVILNNCSMDIDVGGDFGLKLENSGITFIDCGWNSIDGIEFVTYGEGDRAKTNHTHIEADITNLDHDAAKIDGVGVDLTGITDGQTLIYDLATTKIIPGAGGGGGHTIEDEGTPLTQRASLNFVGSQVAVTDDEANDRTVVTISNFVISGNVSPAICQGRLTLESGVPVSTSDQTAKTTLYWTPYNGDMIGLFDGTDTWTIYAITEKSISLAGLTANKNYDVFMYDNSGTPTLELLVWTDDTNRATTLTIQDGIYVKTGATTRRYLGTIRITSTTGQCEDSLTKRFVWNYYNHVFRLMYLEDTNTHNYSTATFRAWNNNANLVLSFVVGISQKVCKVAFTAATKIRTAGRGAIVVAGYDSISARISNLYRNENVAVSALNAYMSTTMNHLPGVGYHYYSFLEYAEAGESSFELIYAQCGIWA